MIRCLDSPFSVLDKPDSLSQCVSHVPFVKSACKLTFSGVFLQRALNLRTLALTTRCPVCHVTFALRYLAVAHASHVKPRSGAIRSCRQAIFVWFQREGPGGHLKPLIIEARRLGTVAREVGKSHVPAPWVAQRTRKSSSDDGDCPPQPAERLRWAPVSRLSPVAIEQPCHVCPDVGSLVHKSLEKNTSVTAVSCASFMRRRWSESAIMPRIVPPLGVSRKACLKDVIFGGPGSRPAAPCVTWSTQPCLVCSAMHRYARSACILVLFSRVLLLGHLLFLVRVLQVRPHPVESVRVGFMSCSLQSWLACILSRRRSCACCSIWWFPRTYSFFWCCSIPFHL